MADSKITALTAKTVLAGNDEFPITDSQASNATKRILFSSMLSQWMKDGELFNGKISPTVTSNNLTLALKTWAGTDPSAADPAYIKINGTVRAIVTALSVTKNAGTGWFALDGRFATKEVDLFPYLGYNATDGVVIGFARIPWANIYSDFSTTSTNEKYCAISTITNAAAGDNYVVIGRFAAMLSATAAFNWSVPTYTTINLIQKPIYETRWLDWLPAYTGVTSVTTTYARYQLFGFKRCTFENRYTGTISGTPASLSATAPFEAAQSANSVVCGPILFADAGTALGFGGCVIGAGTPDNITSYKYNVANWAATPVSNTYGEYETE